MEQRSERVIIDTAHYRVTGTITLPAEGYRSRISDYFNSSERDFIPLTDAVLEPYLEYLPRMERDFIALARAQIVFVVSAGEVSETDSRWLPPDNAATP